MNGITKDSSQTYESLCDTQKRYDYERQLFEEKLKAKEAELALERNKTENLTTMIGGRREMPVSMQQGLQENTFLQKELTELREKAARYQQLEAEARQLREKVNEFEKERQGKTVVSGAVEHKIKHFQDREAAHLLDLENLARGFAHRVRNYLGIISGTVQMVVSRSKISDEVKEQLDIVEQNAREMLTSIEEFLSLAKIPELNYELISVNDLVNNVSLVVEDTLKNQGVEIEKLLAEQLPKAHIDKHLIGEVLESLLHNAAESMQSGGTAKIETGLDAEREVIYIKVIDKGKGISDNHVKKVYQPYFSTKKGHKGLGLTLCRRVAELHHGLLNLETKKGAGTTVTLMIPITQDIQIGKK